MLYCLATASSDLPVIPAFFAWAAPLAGDDRPLIQRDDPGPGSAVSGSISSFPPNPWQSGQAPCGVLKENVRGSISGRTEPCSGQARCSEKCRSCPASGLCFSFQIRRYLEICAGLSSGRSGILRQTSAPFRPSWSGASGLHRHLLGSSLPRITSRSTTASIVWIL